jgi:hypothetical protein
MLTYALYGLGAWCALLAACVTIGKLIGPPPSGPQYVIWKR